MKRIFVLFLALLLVQASQGESIMSGSGEFSKSPDLDLPSAKPEKATIDPKIIREENVSVKSAAEEEAWRPGFANVDQWISWIQQRDYRLLYKEQGKEFFTAVFLTGKRALVVATQPIHPGASESQYSTEFRIDKADGSDAGDWKHRVPLQVECLIHGPDASEGQYSADAGWLVPVKHYKGPIHILIQRWKGAETQRQTVLDCRIDWPAKG